ncbi:unnamed protein product [Caenorhabditis brenneri]
MMEIRIRQFYRSILNNGDRCQIQFHSSECLIELYFYYITNYFSTYSVLSLTFDRYLSYKFPSFYFSNQYLVSIGLILIQFILAIGTHLIGFFGVPLAGYVPMCTYPPQLATHFDAINKFRTLIMVLSIVITIFIFYLNAKNERKIHHKSYNTKTRYTAFENMTTSKSVCTLIIVQFSCIMISSFGVTIIRKFEYLMSQEMYHTIIPFLPGVTYANLCLPIVIHYTTKRTIRNRKNKIEEMTSTNGDQDTHMKWLTEVWT